MSPNFFFNVVAPTFVTEGVAFVGITTLGEDVKGKDEVNQLFSMKTESGRSIMRTIVMDQVCDECKAKGTIGTCQHKMGELPYWQDPRRRQQLAQMMSKDHYESYMRETQYALFLFILSPHASGPLFFLLQQGSVGQFDVTELLRCRDSPQVARYEHVPQGSDHPGVSYIRIRRSGSRRGQVSLCHSVCRVS